MSFHQIKKIFLICLKYLESSSEGPIGQNKFTGFVKVNFWAHFELMLICDGNDLSLG